MEREIKFRAWDSQNNTIFSNEQILEIGITFSEMVKDITKFPLMQYTGLKDKNGVDIYEGDKLWCEWVDGNNNSKDCVAYVKYNAPSMVIMRETLDGVMPYDFNYFSTHEVIGNIYENPELLKD